MIDERELRRNVEAKLMSAYARYPKIVLSIVVSLVSASVSMPFDGKERMGRPLLVVKRRDDVQGHSKAQLQAE